jgi:hypothetical protein
MGGRAVLVCGSVTVHKLLLQLQALEVLWYTKRHAKRGKAGHICPVACKGTWIDASVGRWTCMFTKSTHKALCTLGGQGKHTTHTTHTQSHRTGCRSHRPS